MQLNKKMLLAGFCLILVGLAVGQGLINNSPPEKDDIERSAEITLTAEQVNILNAKGVSTNDWSFSPPEIDGKLYCSNIKGEGFEDRLCIAQKECVKYSEEIRMEAPEGEEGFLIKGKECIEWNYLSNEQIVLSLAKKLKERLVSISEKTIETKEKQTGSGNITTNK